MKDRLLNSHKAEIAQPPLTARSGLIQRQCACGPAGECAECRSKPLSLQRRESSHSPVPAIPPVVHEALNWPGQPLDPTTRAFVEPRFGHDFSQVRVHTDAKAVESARSINALAYTVGQDIVFGAGQYQPRTRTGQKLLAHELSHTIQQGGEHFETPTRFQITPPDSRSEREAATASQSIMQGKPVAAFSQQPVQLSRDGPDAGVSSDAGSVSGAQRHWLERQLHCVIFIKGGCSRIRSGGVPDDSEVARYDGQCRADTGYSGPVLTASDLNCSQPSLAIAQSLDVSYPNWRNAIPDCPCTDAAARANPDMWDGPDHCIPRFHQGAVTGYRSTGGFSTLPGTSHGQQCCYGPDGRLITSGQGAGTPDVWSPDIRHLTQHLEADVDTWTELGWQIYNQFWVPDIGNNCSG